MLSWTKDKADWKYFHTIFYNIVLDHIDFKFIYNNIHVIPFKYFQ